MTGNQSVQVLVAHEDPVLAAGLKAVLGECPGLTVAEYRTRSAHEPAFAGFADVVVSDYRFGMEWLERMRGYRGATMPRVVIWTPVDGESEVRAALAAGVSGYVMQGCDVLELRQAAFTAAKGARYIAPNVAQRLADSFAHAALTAREIGVLNLIAAGMCNKTIARELQISLGTVKTHVSSILEKLRATSRTQAVSKAGERGLIAPTAVRLAEGGFPMARFALSRAADRTPAFA
jgi:DNA-binding NarL/FixJ family response regulator